MFEVKRTGAVCEIVLNRPEKKNALRDEDFVALTRILEAAGSDGSRCVLIYGAGGAFCAGRDIGTTDPTKVDAEKLIVETVNPLFKAIRNFPVPTIAAVQGPCLGGGFGIAFSCDIILAADKAIFGNPFRNLGAVPDSGIHYFMRERLGHHIASELIYTGRMITGAEAAQSGLVNRAFSDDEVIDKARAMAASIAAGPTQAFKASKQIFLSSKDFDDVLSAEAKLQGKIIRSRDAIEGFTAFQQKRKPTFVGE